MIATSYVTVWSEDGVKLSTWPYEVGYWKAMVPDASEVPNGTMLLLGVCGNTVGRLALQKFPSLSIDYVDIIDQGIEGTPVILQDAYEFVMETTKTYDFVAIDLYANGSFPAFIFKPDFVNRLKVIAGTVCLNLVGEAFDLSAYSVFKNQSKVDSFMGNVIWRLKL